MSMNRAWSWWLLERLITFHIVVILCRYQGLSFAMINGITKDRKGFDASVYERDLLGMHTTVQYLTHNFV